MNEIAIAVTPLLSLPWWFFPGYEVLKECFSCWLFGQILTIPFWIAVAFAVIWLLGER
tara:strand:- start:268 stop:441 length:174 start_codon:yes stop_codon:yes gene_type:complete